MGSETFQIQHDFSSLGPTNPCLSPQLVPKTAASAPTASSVSGYSVPEIWSAAAQAVPAGLLAPVTAQAVEVTSLNCQHITTPWSVFFFVFLFFSLFLSFTYFSFLRPPMQWLSLSLQSCPCADSICKQSRQIPCAKLPVTLDVNRNCRVHDRVSGIQHILNSMGIDLKYSLGHPSLSNSN